jgi:hypothetical protein
MPDQPAPPPSEPKNHSPALPQQLRDQLAKAEQLRADIALANTPELPADPPAEPSPPAGDPPPQGESWEQRARSMAGRAEQYAKTNQALSERLQQLERQLATSAVKGAAEPEPKSYDKPKLITPDEERDYGSDFLQVVGKRAKEEFAPEFDQLADRLRRLEGRIDGVGQVIEKTQVQDVYGTLGGAVPNWRDINKHPAFKQWLELPDTYSGRKRRDMLLEAFSGHDSPRVVAFFKGFLSEASGPPQNPPGPGPSAPPLPNGNGSGRPSLEDFAAPGGARSSPQGNLPPDKPVYTSAWIAEFTRDKLRGVYRGREADADAIERDIFLAQHEGRIH